MDPELKKLIDDIKNGVVGLREGLAAVQAWGLEKGRLQECEKAVTQIQKDLADKTRSLEERLQRAERLMRTPAGQYRGVLGSEENARAFGLLMLARIGGQRDAEDVLKREHKDFYERAQAGSPGSAGGLLVPTEIGGMLDRLVEDYGVWARTARRVPMSTDKQTWMRGTGGIVTYKPGENTAATGSEIGFEAVNLTAEEWTALVLWPKTLAADAGAALGEMIAQEMAYKFAQDTDDAAFKGDGTPTYKGVIGLVNRLSDINGVDDGGGIVLGSGNAYSELVEADFLAAVGRLPTRAQRNAAWYVSNGFYWTVMAKLTLAKGGVTTAEFNGVRRLLFLGFPVELCPSMPSTAANSQVCALFGDMSMSSMNGVRGELAVDTSNDVKFIERQTAMLGVQRRAIAHHNLGNASSAGAIIGLMTAAA